MANYIQVGGFSAASLRSQDHSNGDIDVIRSGSSSNNNNINANGNSRYPVDIANSRSGMKSYQRGRRPTRTTARGGFRPCCGFGVFILIILCIVSGTVIGGNFLFAFLRSSKGGHALSHSNKFLENQDQASLFSFWNLRTDRIGSEDWEQDSGNQYSKKTRSLHFGDSSVRNEELRDRDSRYWDKDDRKRDKYLEFDNDKTDEKQDSYLSYIDHENENDGRTDQRGSSQSHEEKRTSVNMKRGSFSSTGGGLYNERGRKELRIYEEKLEAALKHELDSTRERYLSGLHASSEDEAFDAKKIEDNLTESNKNDNIFLEENDDEVYEYTGSGENDSTHDSEEDLHHADNRKAAEIDKSTAISATKDSSATHTWNSPVKRSQGLIQNPVSRKTRHHHTAYPCPISFLETTAGLNEPPPDRRFQNFTLNYVEVEDPKAINGWEPRFAGHQTHLQRNQSFVATDKTIHCGFVQPAGSSKTTGFDLAEEDTKYLATCRIAVSSCIFSNSDNIRTPRNRRLTGTFKKDVCFVMFVDQETLDVVKKEGQQLDEKGFLGPWKVVLVRNPPYTDARRVGKIPKFLAHRLFPSARYSIWLDSKLRLQNDPVLILEYFLWRGGYEYAISNHYDRHCVWDEVQQNKKLNKYNHTAIDEQFAFYQADGLTRFNASDPQKLLPSNVPEGSFIIREHTPMSNLFSCLWFNEVDRFTSRDQLSFAYTYMKLRRTNPGKHFHFNMFKDCERKSIAKLYRHRKNGSNTIDAAAAAHEKSAWVQ